MIKNIFNIAFTVLLFLVVIYGCKQKKLASEPTEKVIQSDSVVSTGITHVDAIIIKKSSFNEELLSNGNLVAIQKSFLMFRVSGTIKDIFVKNGDLVSKGQILAQISPFTYERQFSDAEIAYKKAELEFQDMMVSRGYDLNQLDQVPKNIYEMASIRSGFSEAKNHLESASFELNSTKLKAPFKGKIANIEFKKYDQVNEEVPFLTIIDDSVFEVVFYLTEEEVNQVKIGNIVEITAFESNEKNKGKLSEINPIVQENGLIQVKAIIKNEKELMEGMNVEVNIKREIKNQFIVPKEAVILRQNEKMIFKYINKKAYWTYVKILHENSDSYAIIADPEKSNASIKKGDTIIVSGNINLAHNSDIIIDELKL
ncbi:efflux RND transporter periplasmic adaptor subunit [Joostella atrarenae]|uniref:Efflux RND transporter periplasmic adaptor subunit n=1 Tax=Joostella atrarenae TaxID=679257 RepID=A0ABS9J7D7_9FLAO|nr:efflux RND transporter periplasmic adaptor subunit [Joostella atrarenae]MCF8716343.1 efflux RND transporter periplasmic adaptor subunit [Joostella atrarenae]